MIGKRSMTNNISCIKRIKVNENDFREGAPKDTKSALLYLSSIFPKEKFRNKLPPIIMRRQIYSFIDCRTEVDKCLNDMQKNGEVRLFRLGTKENEIAVISMKDYKEHLEKCCTNNATVGNFLNIVFECPDISYNKDVLIDKYGMTEENISELVQQGVLTSRDVGCYWLAIPFVGEFVKALMHGRRTILQHIKRTKFKEILQTELKKRKLPSKALLGMEYHLYDLIGSDLVTCVETSTGIVLRLEVE